jgi:alginate O-acetyltransferase complex protein AlgI
VLFTSCIFLFFFLPIVLAVYLALRTTFWRNLFLMLASFVFYGWGEVTHIWVMLTVIAINYVAAIQIEETSNPRLRKICLVATIIANLSILAWFKYAGFIADNANVFLTGLALPVLRLGAIHLPLGISFFVFHSLSYTIDVFRGTARAQRNPFNMGLYISLFPQLIAGPIVRYHDIADQLTERTHTLDKFAEGIRRFCVGLGKKLLVANVLAVPTDKIFALPANELTTAVCWLGTICYTFQIYFDFCGYSDMAVGLGLMFGFRLPENFNYPYISQSMKEFWQRWHISLSNWFRDYLYIPLGGNRCPDWRVCLNLVTVFFLCGLWHGASWQFVAWGLYHGAFLGAEKVFLGTRVERLPAILRHAYAAFVIMFSWVLFRADSFGQALNFYKTMLGFGPQHSNYPAALYLNTEVSTVLLIALVGCTPFRKVVADVLSRLFGNRPSPVLALRSAWSLVLLALSTAEIAARTYSPFIYFRF